NVELTDVAENCVVEGGVLRNDVWLLQVNHSLNRQDNLQRVEFTVDCSSSVPLGAVDLTVTTNGPPPDLPYRSTVDGVAGIPIGPNETLHVDGLAAGARVFGVTDVPVACTATTTSVTVAAGTTVAASVVVDCPVPVPGPGTVTVNAVTGGTGSDPDGFEVRVDGISRAPLRPTGTASVEGIPASVPTVIQVGGIAPHCRANTPNPSVVTLDASATPVTLDFTAECTTAAIDSVTGIVESTGWPNPDVSIRADDGTSVALRGGVLGEIAQLTGTTVRVWGVLSGLTLDVYHYGFRPSLTDPRWVGIVVVRPDGVWLMGDDAVLLVDPPPGLVSRVGALVWVTGTEIGGGIHPDIFGVLREAQP
ncbi:MAG: hypothetical protein OEZ37_11450, partial [Gemmatimonadota bacterium]|nr:hypothetical protein [Gemmatimonadota bacterium]